MKKSLMKCHDCGREYAPGILSVCPECGGILTVEYTDEYLERAGRELAGGNRLDMWSYQPVLPPLAPENRVSFREGMTPLIKSLETAGAFGMTDLYFKDETRNPTGSFKDRSVSVCVSMAREFGCPGVVVSSSGNGGAAAAAYGTKGGVDTIIFVPESTPVGKVAQAIAYGGTVIKVRGNFSRSYQAAVDMAREKSWLNVTTTFLSPYGLEGYKTIAFELCDQLGRTPDYVLIPVGAGPVLYGIYKGFSELRRMGLAREMPRLVCVQAKGCAPIANAWMEGRRVTACAHPATVASAISDPLLGYERDGDITIEAINASGGCAVAMDDEQILDAGRMLARGEGIFVEPSSAAAVAALRQLLDEGVIRPGDCCVCLLTGHGLKDSAAYVPKDMELKVIDSTKDLKNETEE